MVDSVFFPFQSQQEKLVPEFSRSVVSSPPSFLLGEEMNFQKKKKKKSHLGAWLISLSVEGDVKNLGEIFA